MIIFGTTSLNSTKSTGVFHCPRCSIQRSYRWIGVNRYFTLYFIPLIPMGSAGEYLECEGCGGTFATEALHYNPQADLAETYAKVRQILVVVLVAAQKTGPPQVDALREVLREYLEEDVAPDILYREIQQAQEAQVSLEQFAQQSGGGFNDEGKSLLLQAGKRILGSGGYLSPPDQNVVRQLGRGLGFTQKALDEFLSATP